MQEHDIVDDMVLSRGGHLTRKESMCLMEAVAYIGGSGHTDRPECACPVVTEFAIEVNDNIVDDTIRNAALKPVIRNILNSQTDHRGVLKNRSFHLAKGVVTTFLPMLLSVEDNTDTQAMAPVVEAMASCTVENLGYVLSDLKEDHSLSADGLAAVTDAADTIRFLQTAWEKKADQPWDEPVVFDYIQLAMGHTAMVARRTICAVGLDPLAGWKEVAQVMCEALDIVEAEHEYAL